MKVLTLAIAIASLGCGKTPSEPAGVGSGSTATGSGSGSARVGSGSNDGGSPVTTASTSAIEAFDSALAPMWKLAGAPRIRALCSHLGALDHRSTALLHAAPAGADAKTWNDRAREVIAFVGEVAHACGQIPQKAFATDPALIDGDIGSTDMQVDALHKAFAALVALVPGAKPVDSHAADPLPPADPLPAPVSLDKLRTALHALDDAAVKLSATATQAKSRADACKGVAKLASLTTALGADDLAAGPPNGEDWSGNLGNLSMVIGNISDIECAADSTETAKDLATSFDAIHEHVGKMLAMCK